jgi:hypothetical protein
MSVLSLRNGGLSVNPLNCVTDYNSSIDDFPDKVKPVNSQFWDVQYFNNYKILANKNANESYVLYQCGTEPPDITTDSFGKQTVGTTDRHQVLHWRSTVHFCKLCPKAD